MSDSTLLDVIKETRVVGIIIQLIDGQGNGGVGFRELRGKSGGSFTTLRNRLELLDKAGLIEARVRKPMWPYKLQVCLTPKGVKVAELLAKIGEIK